MELGTIEIFALIAILLAAIKILIILTNPKSWMDIVKTVWTNSTLTGIISLILAVVVLYYLLAELTIIQIFAVMLFFALLAGVTVSAYSKEVIALGTKMLKDKTILKKAWLSIIIWIALIVWGLYVLFM